MGWKKMATDKVEKEIKIDSKPIDSIKIKVKIKFTKSDLVKALDDLGQRESALCLQNWDELDSVAEGLLKSMDAELEKSNYGKKYGMYDPTVNQKRKQNNVDHIQQLGHMGNVKQYTSAPKGTATQQADKEAKHAKKMSMLKPVKHLVGEAAKLYLASKLKAK
jgi:hypothetical protein